MGITKIIYVTSSKFKREENGVFMTFAKLRDGSLVKDFVSFEFQDVSIPERLEVNIETMVAAEVRLAYEQVRRPCIVEHAGLIFDDYRTNWYPGGLTKPMWNTLGPNFIKETNSQNRRAIATAVVAYCDGMKTRTFRGEAAGFLSATPRGSREFYWDTVFVPDDPTGKTKGKTYAEIIDDQSLGLSFKVDFLSQSSKAMLAFLEFLHKEPPSPLWR